MPRIVPYGKKEELSEAPQVEELLKNLEFHKAIQRVTSSIAHASNLKEILVDVKDDIKKLFKINVLNTYLIDREKQEIFTLQPEDNQIREIRLPIDYTTFAGYVAQKKKSIHIEDAYDVREIKKYHSALFFDDSLDELTGVVTGQILAIPLTHKGVLLGVMEIMNLKGGNTIDDYNRIFLDEIEVCLARTLFKFLDLTAADQQMVPCEEAPEENGRPVPATAGKPIAEGPLPPLDTDSCPIKTDPSFREIPKDISSLLENTAFAPFSKIIFTALERRASHIHFEPDTVKRNVAVRFRVDGQFISHPPVALNDYENLIAEIKKLCGPEAHKRFFLQDESFQIARPSGDSTLFKISLIPTSTGCDDAVFRLSGKPKFLPLEFLGLSENLYGELSNILRQPRGVILIVGPAGQGITTTLHACLNHINTPGKKIWTAEETITISQEGLRQVAVDPQKGLNFPNALRLLFAGDPDVIMASSIDDLKTAGLFMEASLKGRLMIGTLRAETILDTLEKCLDMGLDRLVFADAMLSIIEQRLIKTLCPVCKEKYRPGREEYNDLVQIYGKEAFAKRNLPDASSLTLFRPKGCDACGGNGYQGRMGICEIFIFTPQIKRMIRRGESPELIYQTGSADGATPLIREGLNKVLEGHSDFRHVRLTCLK